MQDESESYNKTEKNNSDMIVLLQNSQLEVLASDHEQMDADSRLEYDRKLSKKLKDLGFGDEDMTLQQKEELLAVVIASWETAEEEKSRRRLYEEYTGTSDISSQNSPTNKPSSSSNTESSIVHVDSSDSFIAQSQIFTPMELCETGSAMTKFSYETEASSSSHVSEKKTDLQPNSRLRKGQNIRQTTRSSKCSSNVAQNIAKPLTEKKIKKKNLEKCATLWRPCLSPKDKELSCSKRTSSNKYNCPYSVSPDDYCTRITQIIEDMDFSILSFGKSHSSSSLGTPYNLAKHSHFTKRPNRLDKIDLLVGIPDKDSISHQELPSSIQKIEPLRTSGAFRTLKKDKVPVNSEPVLTTRSGNRYGLSATSRKSVVKKDNQSRKPPVEEKRSSRDSPNITDNEVEVILEERLPCFTNIKPTHLETSDTGRSISAELCTYPSTSKSSCSSQNLKNEVHIINSSGRDSDSSENSSVIDVETIVDDEIEEFVLKRKKMQQNHIVSKQARVNRAKRFKKNVS